MHRYHVTLFKRVYLDLLNVVVSDVYHWGVTCDECRERPIPGIRWKCAVCRNCNLCHNCYMSDEHDLSHEFIRYDTPDSDGYNLTGIFIRRMGVSQWPTSEKLWHLKEIDV